MLHRRLVVPDGDIVVHCGDWTSGGELADYEDFFGWFAALPHPHKILVAGNHEKAMEENNALMRLRIPPDIMYLQDSGTTIAGLRFWGSPRTPSPQWMAFVHRPSDDPERLWDHLPENTDVLVTHGPPYGILDRAYNGHRFGDKDLMKRVHLVRPRLHLFGHIHEQNGNMERFGTVFVNAAIGDNDEDPRLSERIHVIDIE